MGRAQVLKRGKPHEAVSAECRCDHATAVAVDAAGRGLGVGGEGAVSLEGGILRDGRCAGLLGTLGDAIDGKRGKYHRRLEMTARFGRIERKALTRDP